MGGEDTASPMGVFQAGERLAQQSVTGPPARTQLRFLAPTLHTQTPPELVTPLNGALPVSAQLSTDALSTLRKVLILITIAPSLVFWHLPANSAGIGYATDGALFTSAQVSSERFGY